MTAFYNTSWYIGSIICASGFVVRMNRGDTDELTANQLHGHALQHIKVHLIVSGVGGHPRWYRWVYSLFSNS